MLTQRVPAWTERWLTRIPISKDAESDILRYSPAAASSRQRYDELALVVVHALVLISLTILAATIGSIAGGLHAKGAERAISAVAIVGIAWCLVGIAFHLIRYYAALLRRDRSSAVNRRVGWPTRSSDVDFVVQAVVALAILAAFGWW